MKGSIRVQGFCIKVVKTKDGEFSQDHGTYSCTFLTTTQLVALFLLLQVGGIPYIALLTSGFTAMVESYERD